MARKCPILFLAAVVGCLAVAAGCGNEEKSAGTACVAISSRSRGRLPHSGKETRPATARSSSGMFW